MDPFGTVLVGGLIRQRKEKGTNRENPWTIPEQIGKIPEKSGKSQKRTKKEGQVQDRETPPFETPPFSGPWNPCFCRFAIFLAFLCVLALFFPRILQARQIGTSLFFPGFPCFFGRKARIGGSGHRGQNPQNRENRVSGSKTAHPHKRGFDSKTPQFPCGPEIGVFDPETLSFRFGDFKPLEGSADSQIVFQRPRCM